MLTVKDNGVRVAHPSYRGHIVLAEEIKQYIPTLLKELGFKEQSSRWIHKSTMPFKASSLCVVWIELQSEILVQRGEKMKMVKVHQNNDFYLFVTMFLQTIREVWTEGSKDY